MAVHTQHLPPKLQNRQCNSPVWIGGRLLAKRYVGSDPLTRRAYFDAVDLTHATHLSRAETTRSRARHALGCDFSVSIHADMVRIKSNYGIASNVPRDAIGGIRGEVVGFSAASRKRLIEFMACARYDTQLVFLTMTYPDKFPSETTIWKQHFEAFRRRFERRWPTYRAVWRMEIKPRKSGTRRGQDAPHYHLMIFTDNRSEPQIEIEQVASYGRVIDKCVSPVSFDVEEWARHAWNDIVEGDEDHLEHGAFAVAIRNRRHAYKYISKYVAKTDDDQHAVGRRWGRIGTFDTSASRTGTMSQQQYIQFLRLVRRWLKSRGSDYGKRIAKRPPTSGISMLGLGDGLLADGQNEDVSRTVYRMIAHAGELANDPVFWIGSAPERAIKKSERYKLTALLANS